MRVCITGACGFVGSCLAFHLKQNFEGIEIHGIDNLLRAGSGINRLLLQQAGVKLLHGDIRLRSDMEMVPDVDWVIDAAANPSVLGGVDGVQSSRQILEHNLQGTIQMLEFCKERKAGFLLLSTSRVYAIRDLAALPLSRKGNAFVIDESKPSPVGASRAGINEQFSSAPPISLYGMTKLTSELLALEYGEAFDFPIWINRCGVLAGAGQFGKADQGIFSFWIHSWAAKRPLKYIGFGGLGLQVRDCLHPLDLSSLVAKQITNPGGGAPRIANVGGGTSHAMSLAQLSAWCTEHFPAHPVSAGNVERKYDIPWMIMDSQKVRGAWNWQPQHTLESILEEIAQHAKDHPDWLKITGAN